MSVMELRIASHFNIGVKVIVLNNEEQVVVTQWQNLFYEDWHAYTNQKKPDSAKVFEAMQIPCRKVLDQADLLESLRWLIEMDEPALLEVLTDMKVPVLPMVHGGSSLHEFYCI
jgi:acetolactate synthase-1/2/3 large subunit